MSNDNNKDLVLELINLIKDANTDQIIFPEGDATGLNLQNDLELDSLDLINILFRIEKDYGVKISGDELIEKELLVLGNLADHIAASK
ncbi:MAG: acyl carrier protein [Rhodospirillales bacterium]|nr:acyl carrier protein [Rhodospirillales bacterium]